MVNAGRVRRIIYRGIILYVSDEADIWSEAVYSGSQKHPKIIERKHVSLGNTYERIFCRSCIGVSKSIYVHRLVWLAFMGEVPHGLQIDHIDQNIHNNRLDNLQVVTQSENIKKSRYIGTFSRFLRPVRIILPDTDFYQEFPSIAEAARCLKTTTYMICRAARKGYKHKGIKVEFITPITPCDTEARKARYEALKQQGLLNNSSCDTSL